MLDAGYCYTYLDVALSVRPYVGLAVKPCKKWPRWSRRSLEERVRVGRLASAKEPCIRWTYKWAPSGKYDWTIHAWWQCRLSLWPCFLPDLMSDMDLVIVIKNRTWQIVLYWSCGDVWQLYFLWNIISGSVQDSKVDGWREKKNRKRTR